jgi:predicted Zn-dependent peptidase
MEVVKKIQLKNGLRVFLRPAKHQKLVSVMIGVKTGSEFEEKGKQGVAHFLEHMYFKGSKNFPSSKDVHYALEKFGATVNAATSYEYTNFYATLPPESLDFILEVFADILQNPLFPEPEIEKERAVILEELRMYEDDPRRKASELIFKTLFGDQPAGWPIGGYPETVSRIKREDLINFYKNYSSLNSTLIIAGNFNITRGLIKHIENLFGNFPRKKPKNYSKVLFKKGIKVDIFPKEKLNQAHLVLGFAGFKKPSLSQRILNYHLQTILGVGLSSRLFHILREELACAYYTYASYDVFPNRNLFTIHAGVELSKVLPAVQRIISLLNEVKQKGVSEEEIFKSKNILEASLIGSLETSLSLVNEIFSFFILNEPIPKIETLLKEIKKVKIKDIQKSAQSIFKKDYSGLTLIYPHADEKLKMDLKKTISML